MQFGCNVRARCIWCVAALRDVFMGVQSERAMVGAGKMRRFYQQFSHRRHWKKFDFSRLERRMIGLLCVSWSIADLQPLSTWSNGSSKTFPRSATFEHNIVYISMGTCRHMKRLLVLSLRHRYGLQQHELSQIRSPIWTASPGVKWCTNGPHVVLLARRELWHEVKIQKRLESSRLVAKFTAGNRTGTSRPARQMQPDKPDNHTST